MKVGIVPENKNDQIALEHNMVPTPFFDMQFMYMFAKTLLAAHKFEIFEAIQESSQTVEQVAEKTGLHPKGIKCLMNLLTCGGYLRYIDGAYSLTDITKKWCLKNSKYNLVNISKCNELFFDWIDYLEEYIKTGKGLDIHSNLSEEQWELYQLGMQDSAKIVAELMTIVTPIPDNPTTMLDIGGSHGLFSVKLCRRNPSLCAIILDLPEAVEKALPILQKFKMGDRVRYQKGDALTDDFGEEAYDLILISNLMHHFSLEQNIGVSKKAARALKPGGFYIIQDYLRPETSPHMELSGIALDFVWNISSTSGCWSLDELKDIQQMAGLDHYQVNELMGQYYVQVCAKKG